MSKWFLGKKQTKNLKTTNQQQTKKPQLPEQPKGKNSYDYFYPSINALSLVPVRYFFSSLAFFGYGWIWLHCAYLMRKYFQGKDTVPVLHLTCCPVLHPAAI